MDLKEEVITLYRKAATELPEDVTLALEKGDREEDDNTGKEILAKILENIKAAKLESKPICQDTGIPIFYVKYPKGHSQQELKKIIEEATDAATEEVPLRPNAVDCLTDKNVGNKPIIHFEESEGEIKIDLMLKGGGSENVSAIYQLPNTEIKAHRNLDGVRRCVLDAIFKAQGKGCPPYVIGISIAGSVEEAAHLSKQQLLRKISDENENSELRDFEKNVLEEVNQLGIGPLGLGGRATAMTVKITSGLRHPASFFVGISIGCWCMRRASND